MLKCLCPSLPAPLQVSCGPFHCAAISADGQLFTWGEGFGGKLGHGDQSNRTHPALVQALVGGQVRGGAGDWGSSGASRFCSW